VNSYNIFILAQVFWPAALKNDRRLLSHKDQTRLTVDDTYQVFFTEHRIETDKKKSALNTVNVVSEDPEPINHNLDVAAFQPQ
jgi:hypothetical protein